MVVAWYILPLPIKKIHPQAGLIKQWKVVLIHRVVVVVFQKQTKFYIREGALAKSELSSLGVTKLGFLLVQMQMLAENNSARGTWPFKALIVEMPSEGRPVPHLSFTMTFISRTCLFLSIPTVERCFLLHISVQTSLPMLAFRQGCWSDRIPLQIVLFSFASYEKNITLYSDQSWKLGAMSIAAKIWYSIEFYWFFFLSYGQCTSACQAELTFLLLCGYIHYPHSFSMTILICHVTAFLFPDKTIS